MLADALLAYVHYILIIALSACLVAEACFYRPVLELTVFERIAKIDGTYGILAALVVVSGISRMIFSPKGAAFYLHNPIFWTKMSLFLTVGLLSIVPTIHFIRVGKNLAADGIVRIAPATFTRMRAFILAECGMLVLIPLCASLMARGFGWSG